MGQSIPGQSLLWGELEFDMIALLLCLIPMIGSSFGNHTEVFLRVKLEEGFIYIPTSIFICKSLKLPFPHSIPTLVLLSGRNY